jgi:hypothetical protein
MELHDCIVLVLILTSGGSNFDLGAVRPDKWNLVFANKTKRK